MIHTIGVGVFCFILWVLLSGYFTPLLLSFGVLSSTLVALLAWRMEVIDRERLPLRLNINSHIFSYWPWLLWQIVKANIDVTRRILDPKLPIGPTLFSMKLPQSSDLGQVIYANSITLTPGTITTYLSDGRIDVHALTQEAADEVLEGEMSRRVVALEGQD